MKTLLKLLACFALLLVLLLGAGLLTAPSVSAVDPTLPSTGYSEMIVTNQLLNLSRASTNAVTINCDGSDNLAIQIYSVAADAAGTNNIAIQFDASLMQSNWHASYATIGWLCTGATGKNITTNINTKGIRFFRLYRLAADAAADASSTNFVTVWKAKKPGF